VFFSIPQCFFIRVQCCKTTASRMATYAAQITIVDEGVGRIIQTLHKTDSFDNTVIFFLSDNGGCGEKT
jgi:arylsulfatase A-like enzyme